jgi:hypothetical protein
MTAHSLSFTGLAILQLTLVIAGTVCTYRMLRRRRLRIAIATLLAMTVYGAGCLATNSLYLWLL